MGPSATNREWRSALIVVKINPSRHQRVYLRGVRLCKYNDDKK